MERKNGFSIAELLIGLLITMVVGTAMVPLIGPKKVSTPNQRISHGEFYCFYDNDNHLRMYMKNNSTLKNGNVPNGIGAEQEGDRCVFPAPAASYYTVTLIGAGGDGGGFDETDFAKIDYTTRDSFGDKRGSVPTDDGYNAAVKNLPEEIANIIKNHEKLQGTLTAKYTVEANPAADGADCTVSGSEIGSNSAFVKGINDTLYKGTEGGDGLKVQFTQTLNAGKNNKYSTVSINNSNGILSMRFDSDKMLTLIGATEATPANLKDASCKNPPRHGAATRGTDAKATVNGNLSSYSSEKLTKGGASSEISWTSEPESFSWETGAVNFTFRYGKKGKSGEPQTQMIPKLEAPLIYAIPAKEPSRKVGNNWIKNYSRLVAVNGNQMSDLVTPAVSGEPGILGEKTFKENEIPLETAVPQAVLDEVLSKKDDVFETIKIGNRVYYPGAGGSGAYAMIYNLKVNPNSYITAYSLNDHSVTDFTLGNKSKISIGGSKTCYDSATATTNTAEMDPSNPNLYRCRAHRGRGGAVIIKW